MCIDNNKGAKNLKHEKSCGALVYRKQNDRTELLLIKHRFGGHWSFPKGHVEKGENEFQTALREVFEETGINIEIQNGFRQCVEYFPKPHVKKLVVYFLGKALNEDVHRQEEEVSETTWAEIDAAYRMVTFKNDKNLIRCAQDYLKKEKV